MLPLPSTEHQPNNTAQAPVVEYISRAPAVSYVAADATVHAAPVPVVECFRERPLLFACSQRAGEDCAVSAGRLLFAWVMLRN